MWQNYVSPKPVCSKIYQPREITKWKKKIMRKLLNFLAPTETTTYNTPTLTILQFVVHLPTYVYWHNHISNDYCFTLNQGIHRVTRYAHQTSPGTDRLYLTWGKDVFCSFLCNKRLNQFLKQSTPNIIKNIIIGQSWFEACTIF